MLYKLQEKIMKSGKTYKEIIVTGEIIYKSTIMHKFFSIYELRATNPSYAYYKIQINLTTIYIYALIKFG